MSTPMRLRGIALAPVTTGSKSPAVRPLHSVIASAKKGNTKPLRAYAEAFNACALSGNVRRCAMRLEEVSGVLYILFDLDARLYAPAAKGRKKTPGRLIAHYGDTLQLAPFLDGFDSTTGQRDALRGGDCFRFSPVRNLTPEELHARLMKTAESVAADRIKAWEGYPTRGEYQRRMQERSKYHAEIMHRLFGDYATRANVTDLHHTRPYLQLCTNTKGKYDTDTSKPQVYGEVQSFNNDTQMVRIDALLPMDAAPAIIAEIMKMIESRKGDA